MTDSGNEYKSQSMTVNCCLARPRRLSGIDLSAGAEEREYMLTVKVKIPDKDLRCANSQNQAK
jgi:hypothetical protein